MSDQQIAPRDLMRMFAPGLSREQITGESVEWLAKQVAHRRKKYPELPAGGLNDEQIARTIQEYVRGIGSGSPEAALLLEVIEGQAEEAKYLRNMSGILTLFAVLVVLALIGSCLYYVLAR